jgi:formiminoglutamase
MINWLELYQLPTLQNWQGRSDAKEDEYFFQIIEELDLTGLHKPLLGIALLGFECDVGVQRNFGREGAKAGAQAIKKTLARLPIHRNFDIYDAGSIVCRSDNLEEAQCALGEAVKKLLQHGLFPVVLGGGHETAWGHYQGIVSHLGNEPLSIINIDAHFDLRSLQKPNYGTSGTPFRQIAISCQQSQLGFNYSVIGIQRSGNINSLFTAAKDLNVNYILADEIHENKKAVEKFIKPIIEKAKHIYLSLCMDVFASCYAPGVSAPQPLGLIPQAILPFLRQVSASGKLRSLDIVELAPNFDPDQRTTKLAALLLSEFIHHLK